ncbi:hypothetical protein PHMEG_00023510 [Phytophthora megakarya]|uniref:Adhesin domain-containing protein n=1 Tax=Phytophthora megakarya TaxID=4795 RepID=A0A225VJ62_9STRA|nr:hypothetical protein PHMEG_00023510 [Phytophthora megakarya]
MLRRRVLVPTRRLLSTLSPVSLSLSHLTQQSHVQLKAGDAAPTNVEIVPVLNAEDFAIRCSAASLDSVDINSLFSIEEAEKELKIVKKSVQDTTLQLLLPHTVDLDVAVANGSVTLKDKVEGDVKVVLGRGNIDVNKVRGSSVSLKTNDGSIHVAALVEGETVALEASDVRCKRLMASTAQVKLGKTSTTSEFGAIYASTCNIVTRQSEKLQVGNVHGYLRVAGEGLERVEVDSVTGALEVEDSGDKCSVAAHFDSWSDMSSSILVAGNVRVSLQPTASIDVELHGTKVTVGEGCEFVSSDMEQLEDDYAVFTGELRAQEGTAASTSSGKINVDSAKDDAMRTSFFMKESGNEEEAKMPRLFVHALQGEVALDQLNWMDNIKRKHLKK